jgi:hypothetical protein
LLFEGYKTTMSLITLAKIAGPISSGIFAGYTWALSDATIPSILAAKDDATRARQWRVQYIQGFLVCILAIPLYHVANSFPKIAVPCTATNLFSWLYLAALSSSSTRLLFILAAIGSGTGTVFAWTFLRATNGALSNRSNELAGEWPGFFKIPLTYSNTEKRSLDLGKNENTEQLIQRWGRLNFYRSLVLIAGTCFGVVGLALL